MILQLRTLGLPSNIALIVHVSDKQMHYLQQALEDSGWAWTVFTWAKQKTARTQGAQYRYDAEYWLVCHKKNKKPTFYYDSRDPERYAIYVCYILN